MRDVHRLCLIPFLASCAAVVLSSTGTPSLAQVFCNAGTTFPECDGVCPEGLTCGDVGSACGCVAPAAACQDPVNPSGPPLCYGACTDPSTVCATFAGGCLCVVPPDLCGDLALDPGETCDDGDEINGNGCDNNCTPTGCGNGVATAGEQCDAADDAACPGACLGGCTCAVCGDNVAEGPETCDGTDDAACPGQCLVACRCPLELAVPGGKLIVKDNGFIPQKRKIVLQSKGPQIDVTQGSGFDPATDGAALQVFNANGTGESVCLPLPAIGWVMKGTAPKLVYKYKDKESVAGPCKLAIVKNLKLMKVVCQSKQSPINYTLDEPMQGAIGVRLSSGGTVFCAVFGGTVKADSGTDPPNPGGKGQFTAAGAPSPPSCPIPPMPCP